MGGFVPQADRARLSGMEFTRFVLKEAEDKQVGYMAKVVYDGPFRPFALS